jgi:hypothetical protein
MKTEPVCLLAPCEGIAASRRLRAMPHLQRAHRRFLWDARSVTRNVRWFSPHRLQRCIYRRSSGDHP